MTKKRARPISHFWMTALCLALIAILALPRPIAGQEAVTIQMARPTWETGWFQAEIFKQLLEQLGYDVSDPRTTDTQAVYRSVAKGDIDLWVNGWFPLHKGFLEEEGVRDRVETVGFVVRNGAMQGYLVDLKTAEELSLSNLADLQNPEVARVFDRNGNGKADLIGCNAEWVCHEAIEHHLKVYGLQDTVEQIQGDYSPLMREAIARFERGEPILFYTWTPHWVMGKLTPGEEVMWLEVPFASLPNPFKDTDPQKAIADLPGCASNPCKLGFSAQDIRAVANDNFLSANPAVRSLLELVKIPLEDILAQNAKLLSGEDDTEDIRRQAQQWIQQNRTQVNEWIEIAKAVPTAKLAIATNPDLASQRGSTTLSSSSSSRDTSATLRVVTKPIEPFVSYQDGEYTGFSIDLWKALAGKMQIPYRLEGVDTTAKLLNEVERGTADVAIAGISITPEREKRLDFSYPFFESGLQIMVLDSNPFLFSSLLEKVLALFLIPEFYYGIGFFAFMLFMAAHVVWWVERKDNPDFPYDYFPGIWEAFWWAAVTVTTVGYGDKTPKKGLGRFVALVWMCSGYFVFAYFIATVTTTFTVAELNDRIQNPEDLSGKRVATIEKTTAAEYLSETNAIVRKYTTQEGLYQALLSESVQAIVYDAPALQYYASHEGQGKVKVIEPIFKKESYGIAMPLNSSERKTINLALLELIQNGTYKEIREKWFGSSSSVDMEE